jgi:hypothetical protein
MADAVSRSPTMINQWPNARDQDLRRSVNGSDGLLPLELARWLVCCQCGAVRRRCLGLRLVWGVQVLAG